MADKYQGRESSESPSSGSDFYTAPAAHADEAQSIRARPQELALTGHSAEAGTAPTTTKEQANNVEEHVDDGGSSSEMDVSDSDRSTSASPGPASPPVGGLAGQKRKLGDSQDSRAEDVPDVRDSAKKPRTTRSASMSGDASTDHGLSIQGPSGIAPRTAVIERWPVALWQQVFLYLSPAMLSRCLRVSHMFNAILTSTRGQAGTKANGSKLRVLDSEVLWSNARKACMGNMPRPLIDFTELQMLQLIGGRTCQFCNRMLGQVSATSAFDAGPGPDGIRVIWPFAMRTCGQCFEQNTIKDVEILMTPAAGLRLGLPHAFRTPDPHYILDLMKTTNGGIPSHLRVAKVYYKRHVEFIQQEYNDAKAYGQGAADEWRKGLATKGKDAMADAGRWERWELLVGVGKDLGGVLRGYDLSSFPRRHPQPTNTWPSRQQSLPTQQQHQQQVYQPGYGRAPNTPAVTTAPPAASNGAHSLPPPVHPFAPTYSTPGRAMRNPQEVEQARQARKADIERRCLLLEPPLYPNVLQHMESFRNAMQITTPMTDNQWAMLQSRLLAQREAAELKEHVRQEQFAAIQAAFQPVADGHAKDRHHKDTHDLQYERKQEPLRRRLAEYADEVTNGHWHGGQGLDRHNAPIFATQALLHVQARYLQDLQDQAPASSSEPVSDKPFLSLDNMKWVYEEKVRPLTDKHRRELFICAAHEEDGNSKWLAFESLLQHYGAKHTDEFRKDNVVVHWQSAEWPDDVPFVADPSPWVKAERKTTDQKARARPDRNPPHSLRGGHKGHSAASRDDRYSRGSTDVPQAGDSYGMPAPDMDGPQADDRSLTYDAALTEVSTDAPALWDELDGVQNLMACVRVQTVLHHVVDHFMSRVGARPSLDLLTDAMATNPVMRDVKNAPGLACKICVASQTDGSASYQSYYARIRNLKLYTTSSLITHYKIVHLPAANSHMSANRLDWVTDMIEMPETQVISELVRAPGMNNNKLKLLAAAFPSAFPTDLPDLEQDQDPSRPGSEPKSVVAARLDRLIKKQPPSKKRKHGRSNNATAFGREHDAEDSVPEPADDEYDPRRPMFTQPAEDPSRFDTDLARKPKTMSTSHEGTPSTALPFNLAPETLAALSSLSAMTSNYASQPSGYEPETERVERSPSVGRKEAANVSRHASDVPNAAPDISAILASLTGSQAMPKDRAWQQVATPPSSFSQRSGSTSVLPPAMGPPPYLHDADAQRRQSGQRPTESRSGERIMYRTTAGSSPVNVHQHDPLADLHAALTRNARDYGQNQQLHHASHYAEPATPSRPSHIQPYAEHGAPLRSHSPPRYRYIQEDGSAPNQQVYREGPREQDHIQYVQLARPSDAPPTYPHDPYQHQPQHAPPPRPVYVDEYGRPIQLIPIDSAPAPVQYMPHPYEQQQRQVYEDGRGGYAAAAPPYHQGYSDHQQRPPPEQYGGRYHPQ